MTFYFCWTLSKSNRRVSNSHLRRSRPVGAAAVDARAWHTSLPLVMHYSTRKKYMTDSDEKVGNSTNPYHSRFFNWIIGGNHRPYSPKCCTIKYSFFPWERDGEIRKKEGSRIHNLSSQMAKLSHRRPDKNRIRGKRLLCVLNLLGKKRCDTLFSICTALSKMAALQVGEKKSRLSKGVSPPKGVFFVGIKIFAKCESLQYTI